MEKKQTKSIKQTNNSIGISAGIMMDMVDSLQPPFILKEDGEIFRPCVKNHLGNLSLTVVRGLRKSIILQPGPASLYEPCRVAVCMPSSLITVIGS